MDNKVFELNWTELNDSDGTQNIPRSFGLPNACTRQGATGQHTGDSDPSWITLQAQPPTYIYADVLNPAHYHGPTLEILSPMAQSWKRPDPGDARFDRDACFDSQEPREDATNGDLYTVTGQLKPESCCPDWISERVIKNAFVFSAWLSF